MRLFGLFLMFICCVGCWLSVGFTLVGLLFVFTTCDCFIIMQCCLSAITLGVYVDWVWVLLFCAWVGYCLCYDSLFVVGGWLVFIYLLMIALRV